MITSLAGYDEQLFTRTEAPCAGYGVRLLSQRIQFSAEAGMEIWNIAQSLGMEEITAQLLTDQMSSYLRDNSRAVVPGRISEISQDEEEGDETEEEVV